MSMKCKNNNKSSKVYEKCELWSWIVFKKIGIIYKKNKKILMT